MWYGKKVDDVAVIRKGDVTYEVVLVAGDECRTFHTLTNPEVDVHNGSISIEFTRNPDEEL